jgi:hypothetical protein
MEAQRDDGVRQRIEAAIARRKDEFVLSYLTWTAVGYTMKFRLGVVDILRTAVGAHIVEDSSRMNRMLDGVRLTFHSLL